MFSSPTAPTIDGPLSPLHDALDAVDALLASTTAGLDPATVGADESLVLMEQLGSIDRHTTALRVLVARALPPADSFAVTSDRSAERFVARVSGTSIGAAGALLDVAAALSDLPVVEDALRAGELSGAQVGVIADAVIADPTSQSELVEAARTKTLHRLRKHADAVKAAAAGDDDARHANAHKKRRLSFSNTADQCGIGLAGNGTATDGILVWQALRVFLEDIYAQNKADGTKVSQEAMVWDALVAMARYVLGEGEAPTSGGRGTKVIVRVDYESLIRRCTRPGEVCDLVGVGPIPVTAVEELIARGDVFLAAVITKGKKVAGVAHPGRSPNAFQRTALEWLNPSCANEDCNCHILDWDHQIDFDVTRHTTLDELDGLCPPCHQLKTVHGWRLVAGTGPRQFVAPGHPDHPGDPHHHDPRNN